MDLKEQVKAKLLASLSEDVYKVEHEGHPDADKVKELSHLKPGKKYCNHVTKYENSAKDAAARLKKSGFQGVKIYKNWKLMEEVGELDEAKQDWELTSAQVKKKMLADYKKRQGFDAPETKDPKTVVKDGKRIHEGKMSELHATIGQYMDKHIDEYKRAGGAEHLMAKADAVKHKVARIHGLASGDAHKFISKYIDSKLDEAVDLQEVSLSPQAEFKHSSGGTVKLSKQLHTGDKDVWHIHHDTFKPSAGRHGGSWASKTLHKGSESEMRSKFSSLKGVNESCELANSIRQRILDKKQNTA